ncbi:uncharacterized protein [Euwallacea similis]|uniref:uncharacterized protein isoform X1 n=1 Tax=Euwallacea similis TaxID=1736056 RepID=UPI00344B4D65
MKLCIIMVHLNYLLLVLSLFVTVRSFPSGLLNEKNRDVSWEAWLLVDDQNHKQAHEMTPKRRIVPKSVFVAPTFSLENLPPCAEGYSSDPMGRCVKIIKIDESKHLEFLMQKLNAQFGSSLDYETILDEEANSQQPTKVDIPLFGDYEVDYTNDTPEEAEEMDMAIIVTPTTRESSKVGKGSDKTEEDGYEEQLRKLVTTSTEASTTQTELVTTELVTTTFFPDTTEALTQPTIAELETTTATEVPTTTTTEVTTLTEEVTTTIPTSTTPKITTYHPVATTYHPLPDLKFMGIGSKTRNLVRFPMEDSPIPRSRSETAGFVRFPDMDSKIQQEGVSHHTRDVDRQTGNFFNEIATAPPLEKIHKTLFTLPPKWSPQDPKPIILRFSRKHLNLGPSKFKNGAFYRSLPVEDLTYLFGYKNGQSSHNRRKLTKNHRRAYVVLARRLL